MKGLSLVQRGGGFEDNSAGEEAARRELSWAMHYDDNVGMKALTLKNAIMLQQCLMRQCSAVTAVTPNPKRKADVTHDSKLQIIHFFTINVHRYMS